jgi:hypothetical protein
MLDILEFLATDWPIGAAKSPYSGTLQIALPM